MNKPLSRDEQIELMKNAKERQDALVKRVLSDNLVRKIVSTPAPAHISTVYKTERLVRCG